MDRSIARMHSARDYALRLLAIRPRSLQEMRDRLARKGFERQAIESAIAELTALGLLDDRKFAAQWIESRISLRPMGQTRLRSELLAKGVDRQIIETILSRYNSEIDEDSAALALAEKKMTVLQGLEPDVVRRRLIGFLQRRGFKASAINNALRKYNLLKI